MTIEDAIKHLDLMQVNIAGELAFSAIAKTYYEAVDMAIAALRAQQEAEKNDPLTADELREMEGKPIWRKDLVLQERMASCVVLGHYGTHLEYAGWTDGTHDMLRDYGKTWLAYRRPPEKE